MTPHEMNDMSWKSSLSPSVSVTWLSLSWVCSSVRKTRELHISFFSNLISGSLVIVSPVSSGNQDSFTHEWRVHHDKGTFFRSSFASSFSFDRSSGMFWRHSTRKVMPTKTLECLSLSAKFSRILTTTSDFGSSVSSPLNFSRDIRDGKRVIKKSKFCETA